MLKLSWKLGQLRSFIGDEKLSPGLSNNMYKTTEDHQADTTRTAVAVFACDFGFRVSVGVNLKYRLKYTLFSAGSNRINLLLNVTIIMSHILTQELMSNV